MQTYLKSPTQPPPLHPRMRGTQNLLQELDGGGAPAWAPSTPASQPPPPWLPSAWRATGPSSSRRPLALPPSPTVPLPGRLHPGVLSENHPPLPDQDRLLHHQQCPLHRRQGAVMEDITSDRVVLQRIRRDWLPRR